MQRLKAIFWNGQEHRLRAGWRLVAQLILFVLVQIVLAVISNALGKRPISTIAVIALYAVLGAAMIWFVARFVDRRRAADYGFHFNSRWWASFVFGTVLGAGLMSGIFFGEQLAGWVSVSASTSTESGFTPITGVLLSFVFYLTVAWMEEFTFRGYELRNLSEGITGAWVGPRGAIVGCLADLVRSFRPSARGQSQCDAREHAQHHVGGRPLGSAVRFDGRTRPLDRPAFGLEFLSGDGLWISG
jgi:uncharacterized protein